MILALTSSTMPPSAIYDAADTVVAQRLVAGRGRRRGRRQRRRAAGDPHPRQSDRARRRWACRMEDVRTAVANANAAGAARHLRRRRAAPSPSPPTISCARRREYEPLVVKAANGTVVRLSAIASIEPGVRNSRSFGWFNGQPSVLLVITKQADANVIETVDRMRDVLPELKRWIPAGVEIAVLSDRTETIRASVFDMQLTLVIADRAGDAGGVPVPAARRGDHRRRRHRAAVAGRHLRADVGGRLLDQQPVADGAGGLGRLRGRRRHRDDRELLPQSRKGHDAAAGRAWKARGRSASPWSRSASR